MILVLIISCCIAKIYAESVLFPHGYFDMNKLKAKDAIYLHLMALSSIEYGGITEKELNHEIEETGLFPKAFTTTITPKSTEDTAAPLTDLFLETTKIPVGFIEQLHDGDEYERSHQHHPESLIDATDTSIISAPVKSPFYRLLRDDAYANSKVENPFESIVTRPPAFGFDTEEKTKQSTAVHPTLLPPTNNNLRHLHPIDDVFNGSKNSPHRPSENKRQFLRYDQLLGVYEAPKPRGTTTPKYNNDSVSNKFRSKLADASDSTELADANYFTPTIVALPIPPPLPE